MTAAEALKDEWLAEEKTVSDQTHIDK